jgi:hypothetical protein
MRDGGRSSMNLAKALEDVTIAAGPLVNWMVKGAVAAVEVGREQQAHLGRESGALAGFFDETRIGDQSQVVRIGGDLAVAFYNIARPGSRSATTSSSTSSSPRTRSRTGRRAPAARTRSASTSMRRAPRSSSSGG